jgi:hypothetical protein
MRAYKSIIVAGLALIASAALPALSGAAQATAADYQAHQAALQALRDRLATSTTPKDVQDIQAQIGVEQVWFANQAGQPLAISAAETVKPDAGLLAKIYVVQTQSLLDQAKMLAALTKLVDQRPVAVNVNTAEQQVCEFGGVPYSIGAVLSGKKCVAADEHSSMVHPAGYKPSRPPVWEEEWK